MDHQPEEVSDSDNVSERALEALLMLADKVAVHARRSAVSELSWYLTAAHEAARERRLAMLNSYITYCALLI